MTTLHDFGGVSGRPLDTFYLGSHNFMVAAIGLCVKCSVKPYVTRPQPNAISMTFYSYGSSHMIK